MKAKMKVKYRKDWLFIAVAALLCTVLVLLSVAFITEDHNYGCAVLCLPIFALILIAMYFRFNYGITINEKRVVAIEQAGIKILWYDDVSSITVKFYNEKVVACIRMRNREEYVFVWDCLYFGSHFILPSVILIKLSDKWVEKSIASLSKCEKVKIQNIYTPRNK